jgi:predicted ATP-dependent Lon-type protease
VTPATIDELWAWARAKRKAGTFTREDWFAMYRRTKELEPIMLQPVYQWALTLRLVSGREELGRWIDQAERGSEKRG